MAAHARALHEVAVLGQFLEFSVSTRPIAPSAAFFDSLGFRAAESNETLAHPYVALFGGNVAIGLHEREAASALTFVRPDLPSYVRALRRLKLPLDELHLAADEFNRVVFRDPSGQTVVLLEARTFAPVALEPHNVCACGTFVEYSLPVDDLDAARGFWERLGLVALARSDAPHPHVRLGGHGLVLGLHAAHFVPGFVFHAPNLEARIEYLKAKGAAPRTSAPPLVAGAKRATLTAPDGTSLYLFDGE